MAAQLPPHIQALLSPDAYPHPTDGVELLPTHVSYLFFAGDFLYTVKKPLDPGFLDFPPLDPPPEPQKNDADAAGLKELHAQRKSVCGACHDAYQ